MPSFRELLTGRYDKKTAPEAAAPGTGIVIATEGVPTRYLSRPQLEAIAFEKSSRAGGAPARLSRAGLRDTAAEMDRKSKTTDPRTGRVVARVLRYYADHCEFVRVAINRRKRQISQAKWHIARVDDPEAKPNPKVVKELMALFQTVNTKTESYRSLMDMVVEDLLVLDGGVIEKEKTAGGDVKYLWAVDAASIAPDKEWDGSNPQATRYRQLVDGKVVAEWTNDEMVYMMQNPRTTSVIGWSAVETLIQIVEAELYGETYDFTILKKTAPAGILDLGPAIPPEDVSAFRDYYEMEIAGSRDVAIFGGGDPNAKTGVTWHPMQRTAQEMQRREYMKWLATKIAAVFEMDLGVFNLTETQHRTTAERAQNLTDEGHKSLGLLVQEYVTREIVSEFDKQHGFVFSDLNSRDEEAQSLLDERALRMGVIVPNEIRNRDDLGDPLPYGDTYFIAGKGPWTGMSSQGQRPTDEGAINPIEEADGSPIVSNPLPPSEPGHPAMPHKTQPDPLPDPDGPPGKGPAGKPTKRLGAAQKSAADFRPRVAHVAAHVDAIVPRLVGRLHGERAIAFNDVLAVLEENEPDAVFTRDVAKRAKAIARGIKPDYLAGSVQTFGLEVASIAWTDAAALLYVKAGWDVAPEWAERRIKRYADDVGYMIADNDRRRILELLKAAEVVGTSVEEAAGALRVAQRSVTSYDDHGKPVRTVDAESYVTTVARTELQRAANVGQFALYQKAGVETVEWEAQADPCPLCEQANGTQQELGDIFEGVEVDMPPAHPNCAPAGTLIVTDAGLLPIESVVVGTRVLTHRNRFQEVTALSRSNIGEDLIEFRVGSNVLRVTGNHPVLARDRWTAASSLKPGDEVAAMHPEPGFRSSGNPEHVPPECREFDGFLGVLKDFNSRTVPTASVDFDREHTARKRDIYAEYADREIRSRVVPGGSKRVENDTLVRGFDDSATLAGSRLFLGSRVSPSARGVVRGGSKRDSAFGSETVESDDLRGGTSTPLQPETSEAVRDSGSPVSTAVLDREREDGRPGKMEPMELSEFGFGVNMARRPRSWHTSIIRIDSINRVAFSGTVYNFAVAEDESYVANGVVVHNCRCALIPVDDDE
jgi:hypothetical protein